MPWYWSDDIAQILLKRGTIEAAQAATMSATPVAYRSEAESLAQAVDTLVDDEEIPLAA